MQKYNMLIQPYQPILLFGSIPKLKEICSGCTVGVDISRATHPLLMLERLGFHSPHPSYLHSKFPEPLNQCSDKDNIARVVATCTPKRISPHSEGQIPKDLIIQVLRPEFSLRCHAFSNNIMDMMDKRVPVFFEEMITANVISVEK